MKQIPSNFLYQVKAKLDIFLNIKRVPFFVPKVAWIHTPITVQHQTVPDI